MPLAAIGAIGAGTSLLGGILGSNAAKDAAAEQAQAAEQAAQLQYQASQNALNFQKQQYQTSQNEMMPFLNSGTGALSNLNYLMGIGGGSPTSAPSLTGSPTPVLSSGTRPTAPTSVYSNNQGSIPQPTPLAGSNVRTYQPGLLSGGTGSFSPSGPVSAPSLTASEAALGTSPSPGTANPSLGGFGSLMQPYGQTFQAPTDLTEQNDPGYQARLKLGTDAMQRSAAARGGVLTGGTLQDLNQYAQDYASNEYNNVYNRALQGFDTNYNVYNQNQTNQYNRLAAMAGVGQTAANTLGNLGANAASGVSSNLLGTASAMGQDYNNAAAANASGMVGSANAYSGALGGIGNNISNLLLLQQLQGGGGNASGILNMAQNQNLGLSPYDPSLSAML